AAAGRGRAGCPPAATLPSLAACAEPMNDASSGKKSFHMTVLLLTSGFGGLLHALFLLPAVVDKNGIDYSGLWKGLDGSTRRHQCLYRHCRGRQPIGGGS